MRTIINGVVGQINDELKQKAKDGDAESQCILGWILTGKGRDETAVGWFKKAADQGHSEAQYELGIRYQYGRGFTQNDKEAVKWYKKAAEQGLAIARYDLEVMYLQGRGVTQDDDKADEWRIKADERNHKETVKLFKKVIEQESEKALLDKEFKEEQDKAAAKAMLLKLAPAFADELFRDFDLSCDQVKDIAKRFHECEEIKGWLLFEVKRARGEVEL